MERRSGDDGRMTLVDDDESDDGEADVQTPSFHAVREGCASTAAARRYAESAPHLLAYTALPNSSCLHTSIPPKGGYAVYDSQGPFTTAFLTHQLGFGTSLFLVQSHPIPSERKLSRQAELLADLLCDSGGGPTLDSANAKFTGDAEGKPWSCALDTQGSFVGLYRATIFAPSKPARDVYYVVCSAGAGPAGHELYALAEDYLSEEDATFQGFVKLPEYKHVMNLAARNRAHIAQVFAQTIGVDIPTVGDFSAAPIERNCSAEDEPAAEESRPVGVRVGVWCEMAHAALVADYDQVSLLALEGGLSLDYPGLLQALQEDPSAEEESTKEAFIDPSDGGVGNYPLMGVSCSETIHNSIIVDEARSLAFVMSGCANLEQVEGVGGLCRLHSPVEGVELMLGEGRVDIVNGVFGGRVKRGTDRIVPTTSGRVRRSDTVDFVRVSIPHFLHYPMASTRPNDRVLCGAESVYRPNDAVFDEYIEDTAEYDMERIKLKPIQVVMRPTDLHRLARGVVAS